MDVQLWGELPEPRNTEWDKVVPKEIGKLVILSAIKPELPKVKQPQPDEDVDQVITVGPEHSTMEENVLYTIKLIQHARQVSELMDEEPRSEVKECPPMPKPPIHEVKPEESFPLQYVARRESPFTQGHPISVPHLGKEVTKEILYKSVATLTAHAGFHSAMQSSLQVLTDVADDFLKKFTRLLRYDVDREELYGNSGFPDAMERVFYEMGLGSVVSLHQFYHSRVLQYRDLCLANSLSLSQQYEALLPNIKKEPEEVVRFKTELESEEDIPELHFPATAEGDCVEELQSSLEPGFQMLHSLEQEVQLQSSMEQDEAEVNVNDSPQSIEALQPGSEAWCTAMKAKKRKRKIPL